jgi:hypothetical protein
VTKLEFGAFRFLTFQLLRLLLMMDDDDDVACGLHARLNSRL